MSHMPAGASGLMPRRSSYAAVVSGAASVPLPAHHQPQRSGAFSHLLNQGNDFGSDPYTQHGRSYRRSMDMDPNRHHGYSGGISSPWGANGQLPFHSRAYADLTNTYGYDGGGGVHFDHFFVPSYLKGSRYVQKLEAAYKARIAAGRDAQSRNSSQPESLSTSSSSMNLSGKLAPSHRGMTYDLIEKSPPIENDGPQPLPSKWNTNDKYGGLEVLGDGYEVKVTGSKASSEREHEAYSIRADHPMPTQSGIYYFEVTIITRKREDSSIGVGFSTKEVPLSRPPGWEPNSWAYHGDDGRSFCCQSSGKDYGPTFTTNDVIGCGFNFRTSSAFFTKNGNPLGTAFREVRGKLFPSVGMKRPGEHVWVNFGQSPFVFDIDGMVLAEKKKLDEQIEATSTAKLAPPLDETSLIQSLVLQYLSHDGYVETARAFAQEVHTEKQALSLDPSVEVTEFDLEDDEDAVRRQQIRNSIMEGNIDNALNLTRTHYPKVLEDNENGVYFRLQCRKFVEMIREAAEIRANMMNSKKSNGHDGDWYDDIINHDMELDNPTESNGYDKMDTDAPGTGESDYNKLLEETINFGKLVQAEFAHDQRRETQRALRDAFALLAYEDPMNSPEVAYHLFPNRRLSIAEDVNSAILVSLGKSSSTALERLIKQTAVLTEGLGRDGGPGSLVNVYEYMKPHPPPRAF